MSFYKWQSQSFDYVYHTKTGDVMRYVAGTSKGVFACSLQPNLKSIAEVKQAYLVKYQEFGR